MPLSIAVLLACNNVTNTVEKTVNSEVSKSKIEMDDEIEKSKAQFNASYTKAAAKAKDSSAKRNLQGLQLSIVQTATYLDRLKKEMDKLDENDVKNVERVKTIFVSDNVGDTVFSKLQSSISKAQEIALSNESKSAIASIRDSILYEADGGQWKAQLFGLTNPLGASMILYGYQTQIYKIGMESLKGY